MTDNNQPPTVPLATFQAGGRLLLDGYLVTHEFYGVIKMQVDSIVPYLEREDTYLAEHVCAAEFWKLLNNDERRLAGRIVASMVANNEVPLKYVADKHKYPRHYQLQ